MKFVTLVRHAAAVHDSSFRDFDRPLRQKGIEKARLTASRLEERGIRPDLIISSPAARAFETAEIYIEASNSSVRVEDIIKLESLYLPSPGDILDCLRAVEEGYSEVFIFSHNNGISWAAQELSGDRSILMPTGSAVRIELNTGLWRDVLFGCGRKLDFLP